MPELQDVLQVHGAQRQAERAQRLGRGDAPGVQHLHLKAGPRQLCRRHLQESVRPRAPLPATPSACRPAQTHVEGADLVEHRAACATVHLCLVRVPSGGAEADAGVGVCRAASAPSP